jgi:hypothetical protein
MRRETQGKRGYGQKLYILLDDEAELPDKEKRLLVFYRAMIQELGDLRQSNMEGTYIARPRTVSKRNLESLVEGQVRLVSSFSLLRNTCKSG